MSPNDLDYYRLLGLPRDATTEEIRRAYRNAALRYHPDKNVNPGDTEVFLQVQEAYQTLLDPGKRAAYDATLPPEPPAARELALQIYYSRPSLAVSDQPQLIYAMLELGALNTAVSRRPPLNVCLVIDKSTSMQGRKMDKTKSVALKILRQLSENDIFSIVAFSDYAEVVIPAGYHADRPRAEAQIYKLTPAGGTEIFRGLQAGLNEVRRFRDAGRVNHIILLTDGRTYGDEAESLQLADRAASEGVVISAMGLGKDWNDDFLDDLSSRTGGSSNYIASVGLLENFLLGKIDALENVYAQDIILDYFTGDDVQVTYIYRVQPEPMALPVESPVALGMISYKQSLRLLFELSVSKLAYQDEDKILLSGRLNADIVQMRGRRYQTYVRFLRPVSRTEEADGGAAAMEKKMLAALADMSLYRLQEKARLTADAGESASAARYLQYLATQLLDRGDRSLAKTALLEADNLLRRGELSESGRKDIKYGTRALLLPPESRNFKE